MLPLTHAPAWRFASVLLIAAVLYLSLAPNAVQPPLSTHSDKVDHALAYVCLAVWFTGLVARPRYWVVGLVLAALGLAIEILQAAMPFGRQGDPWDMLANVIGILVGLTLAHWVTGGWALKVDAWLSRN